MTYDPFDHDFERGLQNRRTILGDDWVDRSLNNANAFNADFQNLITRFAWNEIWGRPGLEYKTRRAIVLSITIALGRWEEFELHVRAALRPGADGGMTPDELKEVLMQSAIYAGVPAANTAFAHTQAILREMNHPLSPTQPGTVPHPGVGHERRTASRPALHYTIREPRNGQPPRRTVVLSHALGMDLSMWDGLATLLAGDSRVIAYDHRGHGGSEAPEGAYDMAALADDAARLLLELDTGPVTWIGLSMGGMVGQELALRHPALVQALVIANSSSGYPEAARDAWKQRIATVREQGIEAIADTVMGRYFHDAFRATHGGTVARWRRRLTSTDPVGYAGCCHAVGNVDTTARLSAIAAPVLVIAGELDQGAPVAMSQTIADAIPGAQLVVLPDASHIAAIEQPAAFARAIQAFLENR
ncbi:bifunctional 4-carboxymuconolactone decarboxylase/3-oxoadipate enol-lactonase PcaCD [Pseudoduganella umbonata]|uniref:3-oxoadipate enol-lactonase n=1 Tax=Pseudoduganella umbonata TaxID=864828 RepID=A0A4P8HM57_9BURK|nr:alpha/beta fold hydrolase [Pseudoduganella umbonata]MBB3219291.1 3-oxoadipate enol-lactonase [Pseudoduganella umbonata]QCP09398.1 alpha/beta fold hydrolase [Pseudoduganella umbonata]